MNRKLRAKRLLIAVTLGLFLLTNSYQGCAPGFDSASAPSLAATDQNPDQNQETTQSEEQPGPALDVPPPLADGAPPTTPSIPIAPPIDENSLPIQLTPAPPMALLVPSYRPPLQDRYLLADFFSGIFYDPANTNATVVQELIQKNILSRANYLGGACQAHDSAQCISIDRTSDGRAARQPASSPAREALRANVCHGVMALDDAIRTALSRAGVSETAPFDNAQIKKIYQLFYPVSEPTPAFYTTARVLLSSAQTQASAFAAWRTLLLAVCLSPGWQLL